jgi:16S rRNA (cytosine1402-N4)-methyltransferase
LSGGIRLLENFSNVMRTRRSQFSSDPVSSRPSALLGEGRHQPVLLHEALDVLAIAKDDIVVDATLGGAGHAREIAARLGEKGMLIGFDLDHDAIERAREALKGVPCRVHLVETNFRNLDAELGKLGVEKIDKALFDLGWSSDQLDAGRGFSFKSGGPLLMTYSQAANALTARRIVNEWAEESLADIIFGWGEERYSRRIAKAIALRRESRPFATADDLAQTIVLSVPARYRFGRIHPATRTFQALRIAANDELGALTAGLQAAWHALALRGRVAVISFHSIEDRIIKQAFAQWEKAGEGKRLTKKPISAADEEIARNPRSRSAKLRAAEKL